MKTLIKTLLSSIALTASISSIAADNTVKITEVYTNEFGEILFSTNANGSLTDPGCNSRWISVKDPAKDIMFRALLTAKATGSDVYIRAYCKGNNSHPYANILYLK